jgi:flagellar biosynthesis/type III secretory pathway chaperone
MSFSETAEPLEILVDEIQQYFRVCEDVHAIVRRENQCLKSAEPQTIHQFQQSRRDVLERLTATQMRLAVHKTSWMRVPPAVRAKRPEVGNLIRQTLDLIMKTIVLDRENEQLLLRHQMVPANRLPSANRQNPHFVARLYKNNRAS